MNIFQTLREQIPLSRIIEANGSGKAHCAAPDHCDDSPSMHLYGDHVHCFACGFHGDVTDIWAAQRSFARPLEAALDLAQEFGVELPALSVEARQKAQERREREELYLRQTRVCHRALEKHPRVREWWEGRGFDPDLRQRFLLGTNKDGTEAVIPFWHRGRIKGLIRRKLEGEPRYMLPAAEAFPEGYRPLFMPTSLEGEIYLAEGYIDALAAAATGRSALAIGGTDMSVAQIKDLDRLLPDDRTLYILPDDDESGAEAAQTWGRRFFPKARICPASYGEGAKDFADAFARDGAGNAGEHLARLIEGAQDMIDLETVVVAELKGVRKQLSYATEHIVPLLARITPESLQDATADIIADATELKKTWLTKAIKSEIERLMAEQDKSIMAQLQAEIERATQEYQEKVEEVQDEIDTLLAPGVLGRLRDAAAGMHHVYADREPLELALLVALGAQLEPLPNGRPLGASILLTAPSGRGKNHIVDATVTPLPEEFYFSFEIASGQSLYYKADEDPDFLKHTFAYPNEIEGAEQLWEFLRPMLSKGQAKKIVTAKDAAGNMTTRTIIVEGPVTIAIPTIRNKTDEQLQTRLLIAELPDYPGRVKHHAAAVSEQLLPDAAATDHSRERWLWQEGLRQLTRQRRVVFPLKHPDFALDDDQVSHGARLWANLLGLMAAHAWLEQRNRRLLDLAPPDADERSVAIEATPEDYEAAYSVFAKVCKRTVVNLSDMHRKILGSLYKLGKEHPNRGGFTQREIFEKAGVSLGSVSNNKTYLVTSAKLVKETEHGLLLVEGAEPSWWADGDLLKALPPPQQLRSWWESHLDPALSEHGGHLNRDVNSGRNPHGYERKARSATDEQTVNMFSGHESGAEQNGYWDKNVQRMYTEGLNTEDGLDKPNDNGSGYRVQLFSGSSEAEETELPAQGGGASSKEIGGRSANERLSHN